MAVLGVILRILLKLGTCTIGGGLVAWIVVGGIVSLFFSTKVMLKNDFIAEHKYWHNRSGNRGTCSICTRQIIEELPYTPETNWNPSPDVSANEDVSQTSKGGRFKYLRDAFVRANANYVSNPRIRVRHRPDWKPEAQAFAVYVGLLCGIAWAIENSKARWRFFWSSCAGVSVGWIVHLATGNENVCWALILLGLFVGVVSALASVGAYRKK